MFTRRRSWKRKSKRRPWLLITLLLLIGVPVGLELLTRLIASLTGTTAQFTAEAPGKTKIVQAYRLGFLSPAGQPYTELPDQGELLATRNPLMGYQLKPQQSNPYWTINPQGFRDADPVPTGKPAGEVRIFVLGGSMAFGQLSSSNEATFAHQLETLLNQQVAAQRANPGRFQPATLPYRADEVAEAMALPPRIPERQYRVINAAVPGYASGNEMGRLMQQVSPYNPDMLLVLNSYEDLMLPSNQMAADVPGLDALAQGEREDMNAQVGQAVRDWFNQLYVVRGIHRYVLQSPQPEDRSILSLNVTTADSNQPLADALATDAKELDQRVSRYRNHLLQMVRWSSAARKRLFVGIQPDMASRQQAAMTPEETAMMAELGDNYAERVQAGYAKLNGTAKQVAQTSANVSFLDLQQLYQSSEGRAFQSPNSLTDEANKVLAEQFYQAIVDRLAIEPEPYGS